MGEIVQIQVGLCGNRVGNQFWKTISEEHGLDEQGRFVGRSSDMLLDRINVYYEETSTNTYAPRAVLVSLDATATHAVTDHVACAGTTFRPEDVVTGRGCGTAGIWPRGYYAADGVPGRVLEAARSAAEKCDRLQGFQVVHSAGGGTGSGLGARVVDDVRPVFPGRTVVAYSVWPDGDGRSPAVAAAAPYNATMAAARLTDRAHCTYVLDNRKLRRDAAGSAYSDLNRAASRAMAGVTAALRFPAADARPNASLRKSVTDLVPDAEMPFLVPGFAAAGTAPGPLAARLLAAAAASPDGRAVVTAAAITLRGARDPRHPDGRADRGPPARFRWSPDTVKTARCAVPARGHRFSGAVAANTTAVRDAFDRALRGCCGATVADRSVLRAYADHGVTADEFREAGERVRSLADRYRCVQDGQDYEEYGRDGSDDDYDHDDDHDEAGDYRSLHGSTDDAAAVAGPDEEQRSAAVHAPREDDEKSEASVTHED